MTGREKHEDANSSSIEHDEASVMLWTYMAANGIGSLQFIDIQTTNKHIRNQRNSEMHGLF